MAEKTGMTLKRQLVAGVLGVLVYVILYFFLTWNAYWGIDGFISRDLTRQIQIGRLYERLGTAWIAIADMSRMDGSLLPPMPNRPGSESLTLAFEQDLRDLDSLIIEGDRRRVFIEVNSMASSYMRQLRDFERLQERRVAILRRERKKRAVVSGAFESQAKKLADSLKTTMQDFLDAMRHPDFQSAVGNTATLMVKMGRLEKDLSFVQSEVSQYLIRDPRGDEGREQQRTQQAERIQKRLQVIISQIDRSLEEEPQPLKTRVLNSLRPRIVEFKRSFVDLREAVENPESERLEVEDELRRLEATLIMERTHGVQLALSEAKAFWESIGRTSMQLQARTRFDFGMSLVCFAASALAGLFILLRFPERIVGPLRRLNEQFKRFDLQGADVTVSASGLQEIDDLGNGFATLGTRLREQYGHTQQYISVLSDLGKIYSELHATTAISYDRHPGLESAINMVLEKLHDCVPGIALAKVMLIQFRKGKNDENGRERRRTASSADGLILGYVRSGDAVVGEAFKTHPEFLTYSESLGQRELFVAQSWVEFMRTRPTDVGLSERVTRWVKETVRGRTGKSGVSSEDMKTPEYCRFRWLIEFLAQPHVERPRAALEADREGFFMQFPELRPFVEFLEQRESSENLDSVEFIPHEQGLTGFEEQQQDLGTALIFADRRYERGLSGICQQKTLMGRVLRRSTDDTDIPLGRLFIYCMGHSAGILDQHNSFIDIITQLISILIESARLNDAYNKQQKTEQQLEMAQDIQRNLLPKRLPSQTKFPNLRISRVSRPAFEVGGDYYDFFEFKNGKLGVVIADAAGKNVPAAIIMTVFKTALSSMDMESMPPDLVLERANGIIARNITEDRFITCMYVIIDPVTGELEYSCAGHPGLLRKGNVIQELKTPGVPLGIIDPYKYSSSKITMETGDLLMLYTDGVTEARNPGGDEFDLSGLKAFLGHYKQENAAEDLLEKVIEFADRAEQHDDITAVAVKMVAEKAPAPAGTVRMT